MKLTTVPAHTVPDVLVMVTDGVTGADTVTVMILELTVSGAAQLADDTSLHDTVLPLLRLLVVYEVLPVPVALPFTYQRYDGFAPPFTAVAVNVTGAPWQMAVALAAIDTDGVTDVVTEITTRLDTTCDGTAHAALLVSVQVTVSFCASVELTNWALLLPVFTPFTFHWYDGVAPPPVVVAVNVTAVPEQILVWDAVMLIAGATDGVMLTTILLDVAVPVPTQLPVTVTWQVTVSLLVSVVLLKVLLLVPALRPFTFH